MTEGRVPTEIGRIALAAADLRALTAEIDDLATRCRSRTYPEQGIAAMLVVEDVRPGRDDPALKVTGTDQDLLLAAALEVYGRVLLQRADPPDATELATAMEMLAARWYFATTLPDLPP